MRPLLLPMRVWDLPVRLFHWALVILIAAAWVTQELEQLTWHMLCGEAIMALLLFRVIWGFIGSDTARFAHFLKSPAAAIRHLTHLGRREPDTEIGHNAAGGWMVLVILAVLAVQIATGLCANDDSMTEGPLALRVGKDRSDWLTHIHHLNFWVIEAVAAAHILAVIAYRVLKGHNLVVPMITGKKRLPGATRAPRMIHPLIAAGALAVSSGAVWLFLRLMK